MENVQTNSVPENAKEYSSFRYALGAVLAFFGFSSKTHRGSKKRAKLVADIATYIVLLLGGFLMVYPFWWMIASSFANTSTPTLSGQVATMIWWPTNALPATTADGRELNLFYNYHILFTEGMRGLPGASNGFTEGYTYWRAVLNNLIYSVVPVVVGVVMSAAAAFSFAKIEWVGRNAVFMFLLAAIMVPGPSIMTTQYVMYVSFGWLSGQGYPKERVIPEQRNKKILDGVRAVSYRKLTDILKELDQDLVKGALSGEKFQEYFFANCQDDEIAEAVKEILGC